MKKQDVVNLILKDRLLRIAEENLVQDLDDYSYFVEEFAPANIALCKYWGKRNFELNLPTTDSVSISLGKYGTTTKLRISKKLTYNYISLNGKKIDNNEPFARAIIDFISLFINNDDYKIIVETKNNIATAAGFASSASGFAALMLAMNELFKLGLSKKALSILSRLGSGSASRSIYQGFVKWHKGILDDGMDSYATKLDYEWNELMLGMVVSSGDKKKISSRDAMNITKSTAPLYSSWIDYNESAINELEIYIKSKNFQAFGELIEQNALTMHSLMMSAKPSVIYMNETTLQDINKVVYIRENLGVPVYFTQDAGSNIKIIFQKQDLEYIKQEFSNIILVDFM